MAAQPSKGKTAAEWNAETRRREAELDKRPGLQPKPAPKPRTLRDAIVGVLKGKLPE